MEIDTQDFKQACQVIHNQLRVCFKVDNDYFYEDQPEPTSEEVAEIKRLLEPFYRLFAEAWGDEAYHLDISDWEAYSILDIWVEVTFFDPKLESPVPCGSIGGKCEGRRFIVFVESTGTIRLWALDCVDQYHILATDFAFDEAFAGWNGRKQSEQQVVAIEKLREKETPPKPQARQPVQTIQTTSISMTLPTLPIIDISPFLHPNSASADRLKTAQALDHACRTVGFFYLTGHNIPTSELDQILSQAHKFFSLPDAEKQKIALKPVGVDDGDGARGYQTIGENITQGKHDWHEGLDLYRPLPFTEAPYKPIMGVNKWPPGEFRKVYEAYIDKLLSLGQAVMRAIALGLGEEEDYFIGMVDRSFWVMRAIGYPPLRTENFDGISCGEHTDYGCLTFLIADAHGKGSLQVKLPATGEWIPADPVPGCFVCNIGDMMQVWTNQQYTSTLHRVIHKSSRYRVSVPFFFEPNFDAVISPLKSCLDRDSGELKVPEKVVYGEHLTSKVAGNFYIPAPS